MVTCEVCCNTVSKVIKCSECNKEACQNCCKKYLLMSLSVPSCLFCERPYSRLFLYDNFPNIWINGPLKNHREDILENKHDALLPGYQRIVTSRTRIRNYKKLRENYCDIIRTYEMYIHSVDNYIYEEGRYINGYRDQPTEFDQTKLNKYNENEQESKIYGHCPVTGCRGYVTTGYMCGTCNIKVCSFCMTIKEQEHTCSESDIESIKLIRSDSKLCPQCSIRIHKIEGCNQMWCTECKIFFDWKTLKIINDRYAHNPHYVDYMRTVNATAALGLQVQDQRPNNCLTYRDFPNGSIMNKLLEFFRLVNELRDRNVVRPLDTTFKDIGIRYLESKITNEDRKKMLQRDQKKFEKKTDISQIIEVFVDQSTYILNEYVRLHKVSLKELVSCIKSLYVYCDTSLEKLAKIYNSKKVILDPRFMVIIRYIEESKSLS